MSEERLIDLLARHLSGDLTAEEMLELDEWANEDPANRALLERVSDKGEIEKDIRLWRRLRPVEGHARWMGYLQARRRTRVLRFVMYSAAASALLAVVIGAWFRLERPEGKSPDIAVSTKPVVPNRNMATLTLSNGKTIVLDSASKGQLAMEGVTQLVKSDSNSVSYVVSGKETGGAASYNVLATPNGAKYQLRLPDGSHVWLNNASSIRYPVAFSDRDRTVEVAGEAYFDVAHDAKRPFVVKVKDESVEVLGTRFDVRSYEEEGGTRTTLVSGAVRVSAGGKSVRLKPDEQSRVTGDKDLQVMHDVESQKVASWIDGLLYFDQAPFAAVMREVARSYDVEVIYEGEAPDMQFNGQFDRDLPLKALLHYLEQNQIHFRLEGRKLYVLPS